MRHGNSPPPQIPTRQVCFAGLTDSLPHRYRPSSQLCTLLRTFASFDRSIVRLPPKRAESERRTMFSASAVVFSSTSHQLLRLAAIEMPRLSVGRIPHTWAWWGIYPPDTGPNPDGVCLIGIAESSRQDNLPRADHISCSGLRCSNASSLPG